jgi:hypothetical protein
VSLSSMTSGSFVIISRGSMLCSYFRFAANAGGGPRVTFIAAIDHYVMAYVALGSRGPEVALAASWDGLTWERLGLVRFNDSDAPFADKDDISSWNVRDEFMYETLERLHGYLTASRSQPAKIVVWAHNSHVGDASATTLGGGRELNVGQLVRRYNGRDSRLIGLTTSQGTVTAASHWHGDPERIRVRPPAMRSWESLFHAVDVPNFYLDLQRRRCTQRFPRRCSSARSECSTCHRRNCTATISMRVSPSSSTRSFIWIAREPSSRWTAARIGTPEKARRRSPPAFNLLATAAACQGAPSGRPRSAPTSRRRSTSS